MTFAQVGETSVTKTVHTRMDDHIRQKFFPAVLSSFNRVEKLRDLSITTLAMWSRVKREHD